MSDHANEAMRLAGLRSRAASRLAGDAAGKGGPEGIGAALSSLYGLASSPDTAADALALLHELQVHQVEVDLQAQELLESRAELESMLRRQAERYDAQPVGCFTIDRRLVVHELNRTGAAMLGLALEEGQGVDLGSFFPADGKRMMEALVSRAFDGAATVRHALQLRPGSGPARVVQANLRGEAGGDRCLVVLADRGDEEAAPPPDDRQAARYSNWSA